MENPEQAKRLEDLLSFNTEQLSEIADARVILNKEWDRLQQNRSYLIKQIVEIRYTE